MIGRRKWGKKDVREKIGDDWGEGKRRVIALSKDRGYSLRSRSQKIEGKIARVCKLKLLYRISYKKERVSYRQRSGDGGN